MNNTRVCFVEIETIDNGTKQLKQLDGLAIKGSVSRKMGSVAAEAKVSIANLKKSDIEYLSTYTSPYVNAKVKKKINIYAGYEETGWGRIFTGYIFKALPSDMPDTWLHIEAQSLFYEKRVPLTYGINNVTTQDLGKSIADTLGLDFSWQSESQKTLNAFNFSGSKGGLIREYNKIDNITMFEDNGVLTVIDKKTEYKKTGNTKLISKDTGMIGIPQPDDIGVSVTTLLDPSIKCGDWVQIQSVKLPICNGYYQVYELGFDFASREQQFYNKIKAKKAGIL